jgi:hypothetical protein
MTWWEKLKALATRETESVKEEVGRAADALDEALAKKERELEATPAERVDMLLDEIAEEDSQFEEIEEKLRTKTAERAARAGMEPSLPDAPAPNHTGIRDALTVETVDAAQAANRMSHRVIIGGTVPTMLRSEDIDAVVADLLAEVMVLDATRRDGDIVLRTPTLTEAEAADLVARVLVDHLPSPSVAPAVEPGDKAVEDEGYSTP